VGHIDGCCDLLAAADLVNRKLNVVRARCFFQCIELRRCNPVGIGEGRHSANPRDSFDQDFLPLAVKLGREQADASDIAIRSGHRVYETGRH
jgi:hypothetical protein